MTVPAAKTRSRRPSRRALAIGLAVVLALLGVLGYGSLRQPTAPLTVPAAGPLRPWNGWILNVATLNMHRGVGTDDRRDLQRTAALVSGYDLVALNEVGGSFLAVRDQAHELRDIVGGQCIFAPAEHRWFHDHLGNGLLHRMDVDGYERIPLAGSLGRGKRNILRTAFLLPDGRRVTVLVTHIDRGADRAAQLKTVAGRFASEPVPVLLLGDLNTTRADPLLAELLALGEDVVHRTLGMNDPKDRIDFILARGLRAQDADPSTYFESLGGRVTPTDASDHPLVWARFAWKPYPSEIPSSQRRNLP
jgi:endonuclease/exonuclease/phosphatase family metal-dependent hydrolase